MGYDPVEGAACFSSSGYNAIREKMVTDSFERLQRVEVEPDDTQTIFHSSEKVICGLEWSFPCTVTWENTSPGLGQDSSLLLRLELSVV